MEHPTGIPAGYLADHLHEFIAYTQQITREQLAVLDAGAFISPQGREWFEEQLKITVEGNIQQVRRTIESVNGQGRLVYVTHLGRTGTLGALEFDRAERHYHIGVCYPGGGKPVSIPFADTVQIHGGKA